MNDYTSKSTDQEPEPNRPDGSLRSPIRPLRPQHEPEAAPVASIPPADPAPQTIPATASTVPDDPVDALEGLREKMEQVANEYAEGRLNRAQFNAIYGRYNEQRTIIERLIERNPHNHAWQQVAIPGHTSFLKSHFEARILYFVVYSINNPALLMMGGQKQPDMRHVEPVLHTLLKMPNRPRTGLARKAMGEGQWLALALGENAVTMVLFMLEPSTAQLNRIRDLHADFERANRPALLRETQSLDKMVFPQRALVE